MPFRVCQGLRSLRFPPPFPGSSCYLQALQCYLLPLPQVNLVLGDGRSLGLTIRGGAEYGLGIYVTGVDPGSEAESSGLKVSGPTPRGGGGHQGRMRGVRAKEPRVELRAADFGQTSSEAVGTPP